MSEAPTCLVPDCNRTAQRPATHQFAKHQKPPAFCFTHWNLLTGLHRAALERHAQLFARGYESDGVSFDLGVRAAAGFLEKGRVKA